PSSDCPSAEAWRTSKRVRELVKVGVAADPIPKVRVVRNLRGHGPIVQADSHRINLKRLQALELEAGMARIQLPSLVRPTGLRLNFARQCGQALTKLSGDAGGHQLELAPLAL